MSSPTANPAETDPDEHRTQATGSPAVSSSSGADSRLPTAAWVYAGTILVSAFLLFQVQPLISKYILPWFGGSPAVWTTAMLCFQVLLFGGYSYAHLAHRWLPSRGQTALHLVLLVACLALLPITPNASWKPTDGADPTWRIIALLAATVGLPYFVLSTTGPLVQAWFGQRFPGRSPYRLYALSNVGSLVALVSYPFLVEPLFHVSRQTWLWSIGFLVFALLAAWTAWLSRGSADELAAAESRSGESMAAAAGDAGPAVSRWLLWIAYPALASLMLLATTNHVCQDVAVIPFLWVLPLSLYLLTFIICFDHERWYQRRWAAPALLVLLLAVASLNDPPLKVPFAVEIVIYFAAMFLLCLVCHGELVRLRPGTRHLTAFYLCVAAGGAMGGIFVSFIAPHLFATYREWKLAVAGGYLLAAGLALGELRRAGGAMRHRRALLGRRLDAGRLCAHAALPGLALRHDVGHADEPPL